MAQQSRPDICRALVVGTRETLDSAARFDQLAEFKVEFASAASLAEDERLERIREFDVALLDAAGLPAEFRSELLRSALERLRARDPWLYVLAMVPCGDDRTAEIAVKSGAWDVLTPDIDAHRVAERMRAAARLRRLQNGSAPRCASPAVTATRSGPWDGDPILATRREVRELLSQLRHAAGRDTAPQTPAWDSASPPAGGLAPVRTLRDARGRAETEALREALERAGGNRTEAARLLAISRTQLYELMHRHGLAARS